MTSDGGESNTIELAILKNPDVDSKIVSLPFLEVILAKD